MPQADLLPGALDLLILKAVSLGPNHGYGVLRSEQITGGALEQGAVYSVSSAGKRLGAETEPWEAGAGAVNAALRAKEA
jgi:PadR family transcriptional regulator, regulatory protein PadR